jgi:hypothetical protein
MQFCFKIKHFLTDTMNYLIILIFLVIDLYLLINFNNSSVYFLKIPFRFLNSNLIFYFATVNK